MEQKTDGCPIEGLTPGELALSLTRDVIQSVIQSQFWGKKVKETLLAMKEGEIAKLTIGNDIYCIIAVEKGGAE